MKKINKVSSPKDFELFKTQFKATHGRDALFNDFISEEKNKLKLYLIDEQFGICCYCMKRINWYDSHVEHFIPRSVDATKEMDYFNLIASCNGYKDKRENCGHKKGNWYNEYLTISPLSDDCERVFQYSPDGRIISSDMRGTETINQLDLNNELLKKARKAAIFVSGFFDEDLSEENIHNLIEEYNTPENGLLYPFCKAITYCLETCKKKHSL